MFGTAQNSHQKIVNQAGGKKRHPNSAAGFARGERRAIIVINAGDGARN
jgi:hypothetical protein